MFFKKSILLFLTSFIAFHASAQLIEQFSDQIVYDQFDAPVGITFGQDGKGYIQEKRGIVYVLDPNGNVLDEPLIDLSEEVLGTGDHGLLGFELDPNFEENGYVYLMYTVDRYWLDHHNDANYDPDSTLTQVATIGRLVRYTTDSNNDYNTVLPNSRKILIGETYENAFPILFTSHGIGSIRFGTDGTLLVSCGEGSSFTGYDVGSYPGTYWEEAIELGIIKPKENVGAMRSQMVDCVAGKILRLDPETGDGVPSNPFYDESDPSAPRSRVWTLGLRNPFRFTVRPESGSTDPADGDPGALYVGDVGGGQWEELTIVTKPAENLGWPLFEGMNTNWNYYGQYTNNTDAINPYYGVDGCDLQYVTFQDLIRQDRENGDADFWNPCNPDQSIEGYDLNLFMHKRPNVAWSNALWNKPTRTMVPSFDSTGYAAQIEISTPESPVTSNSFDGYSSIPGFFYTADNYPIEFHGKYFQGDYSWWIRAMEIDDTENIVSIDSLHTDANYLTSLALNPVDGCVYYTNLQYRLHKICYGGNPPPVAIAAADQIFGVSPLTVNFDATDSYDPFGEDLTFEWDFGDGNTETGSNPTHTFTADAGTPTPFNVTLTVLDSINNYATDEIIISLNNTPPQVDITSFEDGDFYSINSTTYLPLQADVVDNEHSLDELTFKWETYLHHNTHFHKEDNQTTQNAFTPIDPVGCQTETYWYRIVLTVTDPAGLSTVLEQQIYPYCGDPIVEFNNSLTGVAEENGNQLTWQTQNEVDLSHFEIQRSEGSSAFVAIGQVATNPSSYSFLDTNPIQGNNKYRIKAVDQNSAPHYSNEVEILFPRPPEFAVFPNPATEEISVFIYNTNSRQVDFELYATDGKLVVDHTWYVFDNSTITKTFKITDNLADGLYFYRLINDDTNHVGNIMIKR